MFPKLGLIFDNMGSTMALMVVEQITVTAIDVDCNTTLMFGNMVKNVFAFRKS